MADTKISALPASTTPLAGTEVLPIVQGGVTRQISVANLTAGRAISATQLTLTTENLVIGTSGKGIDFSATPGTGTSELLSDYEEGDWTPGYAAWTIAPTTTFARYTKIGRQVTITLLAQNGVNSAQQAITGLPFTSGSSASAGVISRVDTAAISSICTVANSASSITAFAALTFTGTYWALTVTYFV